jgi:hypothetical protein
MPVFYFQALKMPTNAWNGQRRVCNGILSNASTGSDLSINRAWTSFWRLIDGHQYCQNHRSIDRSQTANWKEIAIQRLKPFVEEFGFLNQDIGFLANVYVKKKVDIAKQFQGNMARLIHEAVSVIPELEGNCITGQLFGSEEISSSGYTCFKDVDDELPTDEKIKLIKALNILKPKFT